MYARVSKDLLVVERALVHDELGNCHVGLFVIMTTSVDREVLHVLARGHLGTSQMETIMQGLFCLWVFRLIEIPVTPHMVCFSRHTHDVQFRVSLLSADVIVIVW